MRGVMKTKPYKRFENLLLILVVCVPALLFFLLEVGVSTLLGYKAGGLVFGLLLFVAVMSGVLFMREARSLRKEHEARIARVQRFSKNLKKGDE